MISLFECPSCGHMSFFSYPYITRYWNFAQMRCNLCGSHTKLGSWYTGSVSNAALLLGW